MCSSDSLPICRRHLLGASPRHPVTDMHFIVRDPIVEQPAEVFFFSSDGLPGFGATELRKLCFCSEAMTVIVPSGMASVQFIPRTSSYMNMPR